VRLYALFGLAGTLLGALGGLELYWTLVAYSPLSFNPPLFHFCDLAYPSCMKHYGPNTFWIAVFVAVGALAGAAVLSITASRLRS